MQKAVAAIIAAAVVSTATPSHAFLLLLLFGAGKVYKAAPLKLTEIPTLNPEIRIKPQQLPAPFLVKPVVNPINCCMPDAPKRSEDCRCMEPVQPLNRVSVKVRPWPRRRPMPRS